MLYYLTKETFNIRKGLTFLNLYHRIGEYHVCLRTSKKLYKLIIKPKKGFGVLLCKSDYVNNTQSNEKYKRIL